MSLPPADWIIVRNIVKAELHPGHKHDAEDCGRSLQHDESTTPFRFDRLADLQTVSNRSENEEELEHRDSAQMTAGVTLTTYIGRNRGGKASNACSHVVSFKVVLRTVKKGH